MWGEEESETDHLWQGEQMMCSKGVYLERVFSQPGTLLLGRGRMGKGNNAWSDPSVSEVLVGYFPRECWCTALFRGGIVELWWMGHRSADRKKHRF